MNLQQLDYIIAVDTYRHFLNASEKCFVTQATLSMMIRKLEDELGVKIFDRSKLPVKPTEIGVKIIAQARRSYRGVKDWHYPNACALLVTNLSKGVSKQLSGCKIGNK